MIKPIPVKNLEPGKELDCPIFLEDGRLLLAAGAKVSERHISVLERAGISRVISCDREMEGFALGEPATSRPLDVASLKVGTVVSLPLYTEGGLLLLSQGSIFTADYEQALKRGGIDTIYARGPETLLPDIDYIQAVAETIAVDCDKIVSRHEAGSFGSQSGPSWGSTIPVQEIERRVPEIITEAVSNYDEKIYLVEDLFSRILRNGRVQETDLFSSAENLMHTIQEDKALSLGIAGLVRPENHFLFRHSLNTALFSTTIASVLGLNRDQVTELTVAALLEDIGMMVVPQTILNLNRSLSQSEKSLVSRHVFNSLGLQSDLSTLPESVRLAVYQHHERNNGTGYPKKSLSADICGYAKILAVADTYSALTSKRPHREGLEPYKAMEKIITLASQNVLCKECVKAFLEAVALFPVGSFVKLSNNRIGQVIATGKNYTRPVVRVLFDEKKQRMRKEITVNLEEQDELSISATASAGELKVDNTAGF